MHPLKIALLACSFLPHLGGAEVFSYNLIQQLQRRGHTLHLLLPYNSSRRLRGMRARLPCRVVPVCAKELFVMRYCPWLLSLWLHAWQRLQRYDVWQIVGSYPAAYAARHLSRQVPTVMRSHGADIQKLSAIGYGARLDPAMERKIRQGAAAMTRLVALTPEVAACFRELGMPASTIELIPNGIDAARFSEPADVAAIRGELGIATGETVLLTVGRYHVKKGYEYIPAAVRRLIDGGHAVKWIIVGKGLDALRPRIEQHGVHDSIIFHPEIGPAVERDGSLRMPPDRLVPLYRCADIFVLPSLIEGLSNVLLEAMAAGLPIVTTDSPGNRDVIVDGHNGLLSRPGDAESLAACIAALLDSPGLKRALREQARRDSAGYAWETIAGRYEQLYRELMRARI